MAADSVRGIVTPAVLVLSCLAWAPVPALHAQDDAPRDPKRVATRATERPDNASVRVTVHYDNAPVRAVIKGIADQAGLSTSYDATVIPKNARVTVHLADIPVATAFREALAGTGLVAQVEVETGNVLIYRAVYATQAAAIVGTVTSAKTRQPVAGATILLDESTRGVQTDENGAFRLSAMPGSHRVTVRALGFTRQSKELTVRDGATESMTFALEPSTSVLNEVIVTGTVVATERKAIPNPITVITAADIEKRGITRIEQLFRGEVPGVFASDQGARTYRDNLGAMVSTPIYSRGSSGIGGSGEPTPLKTFVDGVELLDPSYLGTIDPASIERIEIVTGPQAATIYGSGAMGGVMQIFTKKGSGSGHPDVRLGIKYGMLETNLSSGKTPTHQDLLNVTGGAGPEFSYAGTLSYDYSGQWQPYLFARAVGASIGATHVRGPVTISGSVATTLSSNGTASRDGYVTDRVKRETGEWYNSFLPAASLISQRISRASSQTMSFSVNHRITSYLQQHLVVGRNQSAFDLDPQAPVLVTPSDSLFRKSGSNGRRNSATYDITLSSQIGAVSSSLALGGNGSWGQTTQIDGCLVSDAATSYVGCNGGGPTVTETLDDESWGGFGNWRLGFFDRLYVTFGVRGERNPSYGRDHKIDWTPTNGVTYTIEQGDLTLKFLASYGRATRAPTPDQRLPIYRSDPLTDPSIYLDQAENLDLRPAYSRGPQGGFELYYGNLGSLTLNHYSQSITDIIMWVPVDSTLLTRPIYGDSYYNQIYQYVNVGKLRQIGWEATGSLTLGVLSVKGTYSLNDSRIVAVHPTMAPYYPVGQAALTLPTHTGSVTLNYAYRGTSVSWVTNYIGASNRYGDDNRVWWETGNARLRMYLESARTIYSLQALDRPGYTLSDIAASQQLNAWASVTVNVFNATNQTQGDGSYGFMFPTIGRQTLLGLSLRMPR